MAQDNVFYKKNSNSVAAVYNNHNQLDVVHEPRNAEVRRELGQEELSNSTRLVGERKNTRLGTTPRRTWRTYRDKCVCQRKSRRRCDGRERERERERIRSTYPSGISPHTNGHLKRLGLSNYLECPEPTEIPRHTRKSCTVLIREAKASRVSLDVNKGCQQEKGPWWKPVAQRGKGSRALRTAKSRYNRVRCVARLTVEVNLRGEAERRLQAL